MPKPPNLVIKAPPPTNEEPETNEGNTNYFSNEKENLPMFAPVPPPVAAKPNKKFKKPLLNLIRGLPTLPIVRPKRIEDLPREDQLQEVERRISLLHIENDQAERLRFFEQEKTRIKEISEDSLERISELGVGNGGVVLKCRHKLTDIIMARKIIHLEVKPAIRAQIMKELKVLHDCISPHIVGYYCTFQNDTDISICMEYMDGGSLDLVLRKVGRFPEQILPIISDAVLKALAYLRHEQNLLHRDVKPGNILVNSKGEIKMCDFGVSGVLVDSMANSFVGTRSYMAPERLMGQNYSVQSDIWSFGMSFIELAIGRYPIPAPQQSQWQQQSSMEWLANNEKCMEDATPIPLHWENCEPALSVFDLLEHIVNEEPPVLPATHFDEKIIDFTSICCNKLPQWAKGSKGFRMLKFRSTHNGANQQPVELDEIELLLTDNKIVESDIDMSTSNRLIDIPSKPLRNRGETVRPPIIPKSSQIQRAASAKVRRPDSDSWVARLTEYRLSHPIELKSNGWKQFVFNRAQRTAFGRTGWQWFLLIVSLFYFYMWVALFFMMMYSVFFESPNKAWPRYRNHDGLLVNYRGNLPSPGLGWRPKLSFDDSMLYMTKSTSSMYEKSLQAYFERFSRRNASSSDGGEGGAKYMSNVNNLGDCAAEKGMKTYSTGKPCVIVKLNQIIGWMPQPYDCGSAKSDKACAALIADEYKKFWHQTSPIDVAESLRKTYGSGWYAMFDGKRVVVSCSGATAADSRNIKSIKSFPSSESFALMAGSAAKGGFHIDRFPFINQAYYIRPLLAFQFDVNSGVVVNIRCVAWSKNIAITYVEHHEGMAEFGVLIE